MATREVKFVTLTEEQFNLLLAKTNIKESDETKTTKNELRLNAPTFNGDRSKFEEYQFKLKLWMKNIKLTSQEKCVAITTGLSGKALEIVMNMPEDKFDHAKGDEEIIKELEKNFGKDKESEEFSKIIELVELRQLPSENYNEFISRFEIAKKRFENVPGVSMSDKVFSSFLIR